MKRFVQTLCFLLVAILAGCSINTTKYDGQTVRQNGAELEINMEPCTYTLLEVHPSTNEILSFHTAKVTAQCQGKLTAPSGSDFTGTFEIESDVCPLPHAGRPIGALEDDRWFLAMTYSGPDEEGNWKPYGITVCVYSTDDPDQDGLLLFISDSRDKESPKRYWGVRAENEEDARALFKRLYDARFQFGPDDSQ